MKKKTQGAKKGKKEKNLNNIRAKVKNLTKFVSKNLSERFYQWISWDFHLKFQVYGDETVLQLPWNFFINHAFFSETQVIALAANSF